MLDKTIFTKMRKEVEQFDSLREKLILESRIILKHSKEAIYAVHRNNFKQAQSLLELARQRVSKAKQLVEKDIHLATVGAYAEALEEYAEAACYTSFMMTKRLPTAQKLGVETCIYLSGLCDVVGELVRKAIISVVKGDYKTAIEIHNFVSSLYEELLLFSWRNIPVRKKFDSIKYGLEKLEELMLKIKTEKQKSQNRPKMR